MFTRVVPPVHNDRASFAQLSVRGAIAMRVGVSPSPRLTQSTARRFGGRRPSNALAVVILSIATASASAAIADPLPIGPTGVMPRTTTADAPASAPLSWYGYQTAAADATAVALAVVANNSNGNAWGFAAAGTYLLGAPTVHALHRRPLAVAASLGLRVGLPLLGAGLATAAANCGNRVINDENCSFGPQVVGFALGLGAAMIVDSAALAWEHKPAAPSPAPVSRMPPAPTQSLSLSAMLIRGGGGVAFAGLF